VVELKTKNWHSKNTVKQKALFSPVHITLCWKGDVCEQWSGKDVEAAMVHFKVLFQHSHSRTHESHKTLVREASLQIKVKLRSSWIQSMSLNQATATFSTSMLRT
jgi:hypothetical protein